MRAGGHFGGGFHPFAPFVARQDIPQMFHPGADAMDGFDPGEERQPGKAGMECDLVGAKFEHIAENRDAAPFGHAPQPIFGMGGGEHFEGGSHGGGVGVEGVINDAAKTKLVPTSLQLAYSEKEVYNYFFDGVFGPSSSQAEIF